MNKGLTFSEKVIASLGIDTTAYYDKGRTLTIFEDIERDLLEFLSYIPLEYYPGLKRKEIHSPKLENMLMIIGSRIDSFFRYWDIVLRKNLEKIRKDKSVRKLSFGSYKAIEDDIKLNNTEVILSHTGEIIKPFYNWIKDFPEDLSEYDEERHGPLWIKAYNNVKHFGYFDRNLGNLDNAVKALAALFVLNCTKKEVWKALIDREYIVRPYINPAPRDTTDTTPFYVYQAPARSRLFRLSNTRIEVTKSDYFGMIF